MLFEHTAREKAMWRGWLKNGQSVEISWGKRGWSFGAGIHLSRNDSDLGDRLLFLKFWRLTIVLPLGIVEHPWQTMDAPQWSAYASSEFGLTFHWGHLYKLFDWPWRKYLLAHEHELWDGSWADLFDRSADPYTEAHTYTYTLRSGEIQKRIATVSKHRHILTYRGLRMFSWPRWVKESVYVQFDHEVGERTGSWKGGTIACNYDKLPGETMLDALRRMERERKFD